MSDSKEAEPRRTREECLRAAAKIVLAAAIRIAREDLAAERAPVSPSP